MDLVEAVNQRRSIRAFKPDPIPKELLEEIMELALRAPSWANIQPWEFSIVSGKELEDIRQALAQKGTEPYTPDLPRPREFPEPYETRRRTLGRKIFEIKGIDRRDKEKRRWWVAQGMRLFEAPCEIYIYINRSLYFQEDGINVWPVFDCGMLAQNIMLLATAHGLGTIPQAQAIRFPDLLRKILGLPDSKLFVIGIAIGYPNWDDPITRFHSEREALDRVSRWHGFD
ncbi:nitroreductase [Chloroflexota bacterium]